MQGLLDRARLERLPECAAFINVSRGALVDQAALADLLRSGHMGAATLDVFEREPRPAARSSTAAVRGFSHNLGQKLLSGSHDSVGLGFTHGDDVASKFMVLA